MTNSNLRTNSQKVYLVVMANNDRQKSGFAKCAESFAQKRMIVEEVQKHHVETGWLNGEKTLGGKHPQSLAIIAQTLNDGREEGHTSSGRRYPSIPPRRFVDAFMTKYCARANRTALNALRQIISADKVTPEFVKQALGRICLQCKAGLQEAMTRGEYQANAASTLLSWARRHSGNGKIAKARRIKGRAERIEAIGAQKKPLIDTGRLIGAITSRVV